ncbi:MAG TPA: prepilin-type N-terminal cleavage/methylation domain-containing protein, partial [Planctomycetota bacterium]|nr:prepilin-type N-terminal cleavage/methylation domain-containing protein [Planctomycetota bacterium]
MNENHRKSVAVSDGFTLIELMIVIAIVAIIAAMAVPNLLSSRMAANDNSAISSLRMLVTAQ